MLYYVLLNNVVNGWNTQSYIKYDYESKIVCTPLYNKEGRELLKEEVINQASKNNCFDEKEDISVSEIVPSYYKISQDRQNGLWPDKKTQELADISYKEIQEMRDSIEYKKDNFILALSSQINNLELLRKEAEELNMLDTQEYLNFLDTINKLSIDQDRPDSK